MQDLVIYVKKTDYGDKFRTAEQTLIEYVKNAENGKNVDAV